MSLAALVAITFGVVFKLSVCVYMVQIKLCVCVYMQGLVYRLLFAGPNFYLTCRLCVHTQTLEIIIITNNVGCRDEHRAKNCCMRR